MTQYNPGNSSLAGPAWRNFSSLAAQAFQPVLVGVSNPFFAQGFFWPLATATGNFSKQVIVS